MKLVGLMPARNEAWCLGLTLRAALMWCDEVVVLLHACTDDSERIAMEIQRENTGRIGVLIIDGPKWEEMEHRQFMLCKARDRGATHIAMVDADEIFTGNLLPTVTFEGRLGPWNIRDMVEGLPAGTVLHLPGYNLRGSLDRYHANGVWGNRWFSVAFQDDPRLSWAGDKFHSREPGGRDLKQWRPIAQGQGGVLHLWGYSERRLRAKHALYKVTERLRFPAKPAVEIDRLYNLWRAPADSVAEWPHMKHWLEPWTYAQIPGYGEGYYGPWWQPYQPWLKYLHSVDVEPWQEAEVRRIVTNDAPNYFAGLDLFGVA